MHLGKTQCLKVKYELESRAFGYQETGIVSIFLEMEWLMKTVLQILKSREKVLSYFIWKKLCEPLNILIQILVSH